MGCPEELQPAETMSIQFTSLGPWSSVTVRKCSLGKKDIPGSHYEISRFVLSQGLFTPLRDCSLYPSGGTLSRKLTPGSLCSCTQHFALWQKTFIRCGVPWAWLSQGWLCVSCICYFIQLSCLCSDRALLFDEFNPDVFFSTIKLNSEI